MHLPMFIVDAFTEQPLAGNPAAVCPLDAWIPTSTMQAIASEMNLSDFPGSGDPELLVRQLSSRGGIVRCEDLGSRVRLGGSAVIFLEGRINISAAIEN